MNVFFAKSVLKEQKSRILPSMRRWGSIRERLSICTRVHRKSEIVLGQIRALYFYGFRKPYNIWMVEFCISTSKQEFFFWRESEWRPYVTTWERRKHRVERLVRKCDNGVFRSKIKSMLNPNDQSSSRSSPISIYLTLDQWMSNK